MSQRITQKRREKEKRGGAGSRQNRALGAGDGRKEERGASVEERESGPDGIHGVNPCGRKDSNGKAIQIE